MTESRWITGVLLVGGLLATGSLTGCATLVKSSTQSIIVNTEPQGAACSLTREGKEIAAVNPTPGTITVEKSRKAVAVSCTNTGYQESAGTISSQFQPMTFGNILFGGPIGVAVDAGSGAMNDYEPSVTLTLIPSSFAPEAQRDTFFENMKAQLITQSEQVVERIKNKCSGSACDAQIKAAASAREAKLAEIETKRLLAQVDAKATTGTRNVGDTKSVASDSKQ